MSDIVPEKKLKNVVDVDIPRSSTRWEHPDRSLSGMVVRAASLGHPANRIAEIIGIDIKTLNRHYGYELSHGKDALTLKLQEVGIEKALGGDVKMLQMYLKHMTDMNDYALEKRYKQPEDDGPEEQVTDDLSSLTLEEVKAYYSIKQKMKKPIEAKAKLISETRAE